MDRERMDKIEYGHNFMDAELLTFIEKFKAFDMNTKPVVTILCTDNRVLSQMLKVVEKYSNINFHVCSTFNGIDEAKEKIIFSDAVIVNTLALKIAPDGLFKVLKSVEELGKDIYFILSGWESLPKNKDLCNKKLSQIDIEFPFAKIKSSKNIFNKELEGFSLLDDVMTDYSSWIVDSFDFIHKNQVEALYKIIRLKVRKFREEICIEIQKDQTLLLKLQQNITAKQKRYEITFSHATVGLNDILDRLERIIKKIDLDDILCLIDSDSVPVKERYLDNSGVVEKEVKKVIYDKYVSLMDSFKESSLSDASLRSKNSLNIDETMNDLLNIISLLSSSRFVNSGELDELEDLIRKTSILEESALKYDDCIFDVLERVKEALHAKIYGFQFEKSKQAEMSLAIVDIINKVPSLLDSNDLKGVEVIGGGHLSTAIDSQKQQIVENGIKGREEKLIPSEVINVAKEENLISNEDINDAKWNYFCVEIERLIEYSTNAFSVLASDYSRVTNEEIDIQSKNTVKNYFSFILEKLDSILNGLDNQLMEFRRDDI